jgi:hypothetical protein
MLIYRLMILMLILCLVPVGGFAQVYHYIDENGVERYSNKPPPEGATIIDKEKEIEYDKAADQAQQERNQKAAAAVDARPVAPAVSPKTTIEVDVNESGRSGGGTYYHRGDPRKKQIHKKKPKPHQPIKRTKPAK